VTRVSIETINIGFGNVIATARVVVVARAGSSPMRRLIEAAARENRLVDATSGRRTRAVIVTDSNHVVLSHAQPKTLAHKLAGGDTGDDDERDPDEQDADEA